MKPEEQLPEEQARNQGNQQDDKQRVSHQEARENGKVTRPGTWKSEAVLSGLEKALNALFKTQDHLNAAADQSDDGVSKAIEGINRSLKALQREVSQMIYHLHNGQ